ncbi:LacI family DNA-binding transcriptional regulator [Mesorhizobium sp. M0088]|uniref:LacI family DNA-binding transcriptional regulator n=1 Tax=Mesorhizobium sp. M0088 TaxID=2956873 RepID=UPI003338D889
MTKDELKSQPGRRVTIVDVAREAGVGISTVSNALAGKDIVRLKTRNKVIRIAERLGYRASPMAQALRSRRTMAIGVLVADVANPSYPDFVRGIEDVALREGCTLLLCNTDGDEERQLEQMQSLIDRQVDGMVLLSPHCDSDRVRNLLNKGVPYVLVQRRSDRYEDNYVGGDNEAGIRAAVEHLAGLGHRRIAFVCGPAMSSAVAERLAAYRSAIKRLKLDEADDLVLPNDYGIEAGHIAGAHFLGMANPPSAIIASNDMNALGILDIAAERGLSVPQDLSVIGYDDIALAKLERINLTTIRLPKREMGVAAAEALMDLISKDADARLPRRTLFPTNLIVRKSTGPLKGSTRGR